MNVNANARRVGTRRKDTSVADGSGPDFSLRRPSVDSSVPWFAQAFCKRALHCLWLRKPVLAQSVEYVWDLRSALSASLKPECRYELLNFDGNVVYLLPAGETLREALSNAPSQVYGILETSRENAEAVSRLFINRQGRNITLQS